MLCVTDMMPSLYNYVTVDPDVFLSQPCHMEMMFNICRAVSILHIVTCHMLVWKGTSILVDVFSQSGYRYLGDGGTDRREIFVSVPDRSSPLLGVVPHGIPESEILGLSFGHLTVNVLNMVAA